MAKQSPVRPLSPVSSNIATFLLPSSSPRSGTLSDTEFDSGLNTSAAWTVSLASTPETLLHPVVETNAKSLSDEEPGGDSDEDPDADNEPGRPARALYFFEGKPEFRELACVEAGDELEVLKEDVGDGWSLVKITKSRKEGDEGRQGEVGLLPQTYYTFTADFALLPGFALPSAHTRSRTRREASGSSITPRGSPSRGSQPLPLVPQFTGEWFPSFRRSLLGGRSLNRFSNFVTSGAEEFVLQGSAESDAPPPQSHSRQSSEHGVHGDDSNRQSMLGMASETERHFVDVGPTWKSKLPAFRVLVHSPSKRSSSLTGQYTVYTLTSIFEPQPAHDRAGSEPESDSETESDTDKDSRPASITVQRRFSHFVVLHTALSRRLPGIALPPLPEKQYAGRFNDEFVEARRGDLERYINRVVRHPVARYAEMLTFFLGCESDVEWKRQLPQYLSLPPKGPSFYAEVYHPAFNLDADEASETVDKFVSHTRAAGKGVQGLRNIFGKIREARIEMSKAERLLSYSFLSLITSKPLASTSNGGSIEEEEEDESRTKGLLNGDGAWCWRENCEGALVRVEAPHDTDEGEDCLRLTKAVQKTSETLQSVADLYDSHARKTQLATHESLKNVAHPATIFAPVIDTHKSTLSRYNEAIREGEEDEETAARCETVLNTTMAEMDTYHTQKVDDFQAIAKDHLDGEIVLYEQTDHTPCQRQILTRLRAARQMFDTPQYTTLAEGPRQPSMYERELDHPRLAPAPLTQPCPHVFDSAPIRPVSAAIQEGVGMLLGGVAPSTRASVFGKLW
ncbi:uncharacterized protein FIBRA_02678 [Fibroporia radiculosa]|uniref:PX domain-containing protein n=1 Tax=Fibroporia radiculosa TaxID=599839 RepID=J4I969_9APHY|nr:uncharacterized protein FIBRA_02678 [Fibroporia radiculosa]CCM00641.1 predicted protein [Fibroporia radiculosa]